MGPLLKSLNPSTNVPTRSLNKLSPDTVPAISPEDFYLKLWRILQHDGSYILSSASIVTTRQPRVDLQPIGHHLHEALNNKGATSRKHTALSENVVTATCVFPKDANDLRDDLPY